MNAPLQLRTAPRRKGLVARVRQFLGGPVVAESDVVVPRILTTEALYNQFTRIGGNLTPDGVSAIIVEADGGVMNRLVNLGQESRQRDGHLQSILWTRENAVAKLRLKFVLPDEPTPQETQAGELCREAWDTALGGMTRADEQETTSQTDMVAHEMGAIFFGYSVSEIDWAKDELGRLMPQGFWPAGPRRFVFRQEDGRLAWSDSGSTFTSTTGRARRGEDSFTAVDIRKEYPGRFIIHQPRVNGDVPMREGLVRVLMWAALFRNWDMRDWLALAEIGWKPWRIGKYKKGTNQENIDRLIDSLQQMTASGVGVFPETTELAVEWPKGSVGGGATSGKSAHGELHDVLGEDMSKAVLGQTLTTEAGARGTKALGQVHQRVREDVRDADSVAMAATLRRDLFAPVVQLNLGPNVRVPAPLFVTDETRDIKTFAEAIKLLGEGGVQNIPDRWVRDQTDMPEARDGEAVLAPPGGGAADAPEQPPLNDDDAEA
jgi:phage gp29-like protein